MSIEKAEVKALFANNLGADIEDAMEAAKAEGYRNQGAAGALAQAAQAIGALGTHIEEALAKGELEPQKFDTGLAVATLVKRWIARCSGVCVNLADRAEVARQQRVGEVAGLQRAMAVVQKARDAEHEKAAGLRASEDSPSNGRPTGAHPGMSIAAQRRLEDAAQTAPGAPESSSNGHGASTPAPAQASAPRGAQTRRRRKSAPDA